MMVILGLLVLAGLGRNISDRMATVLEEKIRGLFKDFSKDILAMFYQVILMMEILESNSITFFY